MKKREVVNEEVKETFFIKNDERKNVILKSIFTFFMFLELSTSRKKNMCEVVHECSGKIWKFPYSFCGCKFFFVVAYLSLAFAKRVQNKKPKEINSLVWCIVQEKRIPYFCGINSFQHIFECFLRCFKEEHKARFN